MAQDQAEDWAIVLHGGAGVIERGDMDAETEAAYREALDAAIRLGGEMLADGASAMDAVEAVILTLEDDPKFNAGRGAVFTSGGRNELDSSIMRGSDSRLARWLASPMCATRSRWPVRCSRTARM